MKIALARYAFKQGILPVFFNSILCLTLNILLQGICSWVGLITQRNPEYMTLLITGSGAWLTRRFRSSFFFFSVDIDECSTNSHSCDVNAVCSNNVGSYACACKAGFTGDGYTCTGEPFKSNVKRLFDMFVFNCTLLALLLFSRAINSYTL